MRHTLSLFLFSLILLLTHEAFPQQWANREVRSQEVSEIDGLPVLLKHLPNWVEIRDRAVFITDVEGLKQGLGERPVFDLVDFRGGTEAATAPYHEGKLLIIEYPNPQMAAEADTNFTARLAAEPGDPPVIYRRIGNYAVFVFDAAEPAAAIALLEQVRYEKSVQWLGKDPFIYEKFERYFAVTTRDVAIATVFWILGGLALAIGFGVLCGYFFYLYRERTRANRTAYSDAGGLTRLNLDGLSEPAHIE